VRPERVIVAGPVLQGAAAARVLGDAGHAVVALAGDADDLVRKAGAHGATVAVVHDVQMARALRDALPAVGVLLLADRADVDTARHLLAHGPGGVGHLVCGRVDVARFTEAVERVAAGGTVLDEEVLERLVRRRPDPRLEALNDRERAVLELIAQGRTNPAIAQRMFLSERAVERHVSGIFTKLGLAASARIHRRVLAALAHRASAGCGG
jgi:DNA-binding NarL/FixJ family response regulator